MADRRAFLSASAAAAVAGPLFGTPASAEAAEPGTAGQAAPFGLRPQPPDRDLKKVLREIDPRRIERIVRRLAGFGTRHTLSSQDDPVRGIGAARDWIYEQMLGYAEASHGRMTVEKQTFVQPVSPRVPVPTPITNIIATLRGTTDPARVYVVTGHYDSRVSDVMNATADAPGADDDASGVAAVMEMARVFATRDTEAT
ncbi:M28 family peptidase, partial [Actinoplanes sp. NPDC051633]|uniref:M28 family peptidase n=1 Tax=Actinoplanes sp. NPDC051633 TaxID=3155670 RepID=UPI0034175C92